MSNKDCRYCHYSGVCCDEETCCYYDPEDRDEEDLMIEEILECGRAEYLLDFYKYIEPFNS